MYTTNRLSHIYFFLFLLIGYVLLAYQLLFQSGHLFDREVLAQSGVLDLSHVDLQANKLIDVEGECEFYWNQLLTPVDFLGESKPKLTGYFHLPGVWNGYVVDGKPLEGNGFATFRLLIKVPREGRYGIKVKEFDCAYHMWCNGEELAVGQVGTDKASMDPSWKRGELFFTSKEKQVELVFQISNFHHRKGGPEDIMLFGESAQILKYKQSQQAISYFLIGVLLIMGLHFWGLYLFRQKDKSALYFCLINLMILLRLATTNEKIFADVFPWLDWQIQIRIEYLAYMWPLPLFNGFFMSLYPTLFRKWLFQFALWATIVTSVLVIVLPVSVFSYTPLVFQVLILLYSFYYLERMIVASLKRYEDALVILSGYIFMVLVALNDFLFYNHFINSDYFLPLGLFVMVFTQSFVISRRFSAAFKSVENLTSVLERSNAQLENTIKLRTSEIVAKKDEIKAQADSLQQANQKLEALDTYKEKVTHMIVHDIKNPLNTIIGLSLATDIPEKDLYIRQAGKDILTLVENMLDVAKFQHTDVILNVQQKSLVSVVNTAITQCQFFALQRNVAFDVSIDYCTMVIADVALLERVFVNLLNNAIKFSPSNSFITISANEAGGNMLNVSVADQGPGIQPALHQAIFEAYFAQMVQDGFVKSTGLGLAFCRMVVEAHNGAIWVVPNTPKGAEICFAIPGYGGGLPINDAKPNTVEPLNDPEPISVIDKVWLDLFSEVKVYEVGKINRLIDSMLDVGVPESHPWLAQLRQAVSLCDDALYSQLISGKTPRDV